MRTDKSTKSSLGQSIFVGLVLAGCLYAFVQWYFFGQWQLDRARQYAALRESADFLESEIGNASYFKDRSELLKYAVKSVDPKNSGLFCEFGVYKGETINLISSLTDRKVHGFDSFEGLPEDWRAGFGKGAFKMDGLPPVRGNVVLYKGWFDNTIGPFREKETAPLAFIHLDADLYSSTKTVLEMMADRIVPGTIMQYDEFLNYPGWKFGEAKAHREFVEKNKVEVEYLGYSDEQLAMRVVSIRGERWNPPTDKKPAVAAPDQRAAAR